MNLLTALASYKKACPNFKIPAGWAIIPDGQTTQPGDRRLVDNLNLWVYADDRPCTARYPYTPLFIRRALPDELVQQMQKLGARLLQPDEAATLAATQNVSAWSCGYETAADHLAGCIRDRGLRDSTGWRVKTRSGVETAGFTVFWTVEASQPPPTGLQPMPADPYAAHRAKLVAKGIESDFTPLAAPDRTLTLYAQLQDPDAEDL